MVEEKRYTLREAQSLYPDSHILLYDMKHGEDRVKRGLLYGEYKDEDIYIKAVEKAVADGFKHLGMIKGLNLWSDYIGGIW